LIAQYFVFLSCMFSSKQSLNDALYWSFELCTSLKYSGFKLIKPAIKLLSWSVCWIFSDICSGNLSLFSLMQSFPINPSFFAKSLLKVISHVERSSRCFPFAAIHLNIFLKMLYKHFLENLSYLFLAMATKMV